MLHSKLVLPLLLSFIAGLSTVLGGFIIFFSKHDNRNLITFSLSFSAGVMITISFTDLIPISQKIFNKYYGNAIGLFYCFLFLILGICIIFMIDKLLPFNSTNFIYNNNSKLYRVGLVSTLGIFMHNFPEGIATFISGYENISLGIYVTSAIVLHNIPEGLSIAMPIYSATNNKLKAIKFTFISGMAEPLGAILAFFILKPFINDILLSIIFSLVAGVMLYIAFKELIPNALEKGPKRIYLLSLFIGILIIPVSHLFIH